MARLERTWADTRNYNIENIFFGTKRLKYNLWYPKRMKLLSQKHSEYKGKPYKKFWIIIPNKLIEKVGWKEGTKLNADLKKEKLIIQKEDWED